MSVSTSPSSDRSVLSSATHGRRSFPRRPRPHRLHASDTAIRLSPVLLPGGSPCRPRDPVLALDVFYRAQIAGAFAGLDGMSMRCFRLSRRRDHRLHPNGDPKLDRSAAAQRLASRRTVGPVAAGRAATAFVADPVAAAAVDLAFPAVLAFAVWREVVAGSNWKNAPVAVMITLFGVANALHHLETLASRPSASARGWPWCAAVLIALIGGRIVPSFTRNWLAKSGESMFPAAFDGLDKAAFGTLALAALSWIAMPGSLAAGGLLFLAGALVAARLARWRGHRTLREPILFVLHLGYGWLAFAMMLLGASGLAPAIPEAQPSTRSPRARSAP